MHSAVDCTLRMGTILFDVFCSCPSPSTLKYMFVSCRHLLLSYESARKAFFVLCASSGKGKCIISAASTEQVPSVFTWSTLGDDSIPVTKDTSFLCFWSQTKLVHWSYDCALWAVWLNRAKGWRDHFKEWQEKAEFLWHLYFQSVSWMIKLETVFFTLGLGVDNH